MASVPYSERPWRHRGYYITVFRDGFRMAESTSGYVNKPFACRKREDGRWSCDHMPTGATVGTFRLLRDAKTYAVELVEEAGGTEAWEFTDPKAMTPAARNANQVVGERHDQLIRAVG